MEQAVKLQALASYLEECRQDLEEPEIYVTNNIFELDNGEEYLVLTDDEADEYATSEIKETLWTFNAAFLASYTGLHEAVFVALAGGYKDSNEAIMALINNAGDIEEFVQECIDADGRGYFIDNWYGEEIELENDYYAYRVN